MLSNYPPGAEYDPNAPWNQPPDICKAVTVEVPVRLTVDVTVTDYKEGIDKQELEDAVHEALDSTLPLDMEWDDFDILDISEA